MDVNGFVYSKRFFYLLSVQWGQWIPSHQAYQAHPERDQR